MADASLKSKLKPLDCIIKKPVLLQVGDQTSDACKSGVSVVDIIFPGSHAVNVGKLTFKNCYTASITVKLKLRDDMSNETWTSVVKNLKLMPHPHFETGSQEHFTIFIQDVITPSSNDQVIMLRLILKQPSPHWYNFGIEEVKCFPLNNKRNAVVPGWLQSIESPNQSVVKSPQNCPSPDGVASKIQQLWALLQQLKSSESEVAIGRFDIDGSYDINLLSYT
ncbi:nicolin-1-like [Montipora foliosa]|uniref:nicolin-1-like n=1 Tax=Montipora foliosa TaxID=591990 RepID=UPI0035F12914